MDAFERRRAVLDYLVKNHVGSISDLSKYLDVTPMTIRRDFQIMAKQGLIIVTRGGAVINRGTSLLYGLNVRQQKMPLEKKRIAEYCADLVHEGTTIFIDCGSTAELIAVNLTHRKNITIMTNSLNTAHVLSSGTENTIIMVPGIFYELLRGFSGQITAEFMKQFTVDIMFLGANGVDVEHGLTSPDHTDAMTKRELIKHARQIVVATDHTKLGKSFFVNIAKLSELSLIVTDRDADSNIVAEMRDNGGNIVLV